MRRAKAKVPVQVEFQKPWVLADEMLRRGGWRLPHRWIVGDTEFGRSSLFRDRLAKRGERYLLEVPSNILVRKAARKTDHRVKWRRVTDFLKRRPITEWMRFTVRDGQKEPVEVIALAARVQTRRRGEPPRSETLLAIESLGSKERWLFLSNAPADTPLEEMVKAASRRHLIEEAFENAKGETGLDHYEVRAWQGWHHHMTASLLALWFLVREHRRLGKKSTGLGGDDALHGERAPAPTALTGGDPGTLSLPAHAQ